jgi:hypothetical protein
VYLWYVLPLPAAIKFLRNAGLESSNISCIL